MLRTINVKIFIEKALGRYVNMLRDQLKPRCQMRIINIADSSMELGRIFRYIAEAAEPYMVGIINVRIYI